MTSARRPGRVEPLQGPGRGGRPVTDRNTFDPLGQGDRQRAAEDRVALDRPRSPTSCRLIPVGRRDPRPPRSSDPSSRARAGRPVGSRAGARTGAPRIRGVPSGRSPPSGRGRRADPDLVRVAERVGVATYSLAGPASSASTIQLPGPRTPRPGPGRLGAIDQDASRTSPSPLSTIPDGPSTLSRRAGRRSPAGPAARGRRRSSKSRLRLINHGVARSYIPSRPCKDGAENDLSRKKRKRSFRGSRTLDTSSRFVEHLAYPCEARPILVRYS